MHNLTTSQIELILIIAALLSFGLVVLCGIIVYVCLDYLEIKKEKLRNEHSMIEKLLSK